MGEKQPAKGGPAFNPPEIIYMRPAPIRMYQVTAEKLAAIKTAAHDYSQDFGFMTTSLGIFFTMLVALLTTNPSTNVQNIFVLVALVTLITAI